MSADIVRGDIEAASDSGVCDLMSAGGGEIRLPGQVLSRIGVYVGVAFCLTLLFLLLRGSGWQGTAMLHTVMEAVATLLAALIGVLALVRYYSRKNSVILLIGVAFLGTAFLDGYHAIVTSWYVKNHFPSGLETLIPWSWVASRLYLSVVLFLSVLAWRRESRLGEAGRIREGTVYFWACVLPAASFAFFAFVPLPPAYYPDIPFHRPEEFVPAAFFLLALIGYLKKGHWKVDSFEHWLVLSIVIGLVGQTVFMSFSGVLFDMEFDVAHLLKKISYVAVLTGLLISTAHLFKREQAYAVALQDSQGELKRQMIESQDARERYYALLDLAPVAMIAIDKEGKIAFSNVQAERLFEYTRAELQGLSVEMLVPPHLRHKHPQLRRSFSAGAGAQAMSERSGLEGHTKSGQSFIAEISLAQIDHYSGSLVLAMILDVSERTRTESALKKRAQELAASNAELEQFASVASHDLQEPLRKIQAFGDRLRSQDSDALGAQSLDYIARMKSAASRMQTLIDDLLNFSRISSQARPFVTTNLNEVVKDVVTDLEIRIEDVGATLEIDDLPTIDADPSQTRQLFQNLIGNALKYHREDVDTVIEIFSTSHKNQFGDQGWIVSDYTITVADNGIGFEQKYVDRIFAVFQRLHGRGKFSGNGIGLAVCRKIVERHGGVISARGILGEGSEFAVTLPQTQTPDNEGP